MPRKTKMAAEHDAEHAQRRVIVDEYGKLDVKLAPYKPDLRRHEDLARVIRNWFEDSAPDETITASGLSYDVVLSARGMQTHVTDMAQVFALMGKEKFLRASSVTLKTLEQLVGAAGLAALTHKTRTGSRSVIVRSR